MTHVVTAIALGTQWGVGHGGFHTQSIEFSEQEAPPSAFRFIYDCGTLSSPTNLEPWITSYIADLKKKKVTKIDLLAISHFDWDHVSGLVELAKQLRHAHITVDRVIAPSITRLEAILIQATYQRRAKWYHQLLADPAATVHGLFGVELQIIDGRLRPRNDLGFKGVWDIDPYTTPKVDDLHEQVGNEIKERLGLDPSALEHSQIFDKLCESPAKLRKIKQIQTEFFGINGINGTSMAMRSGPSLECNIVGTRQEITMHRGPSLRGIHQPSRGSAWLGTGDAPLSGGFLSDFISHYGMEALRSVAVVAAPHHGSSYHVDQQFWELFPAETIVTMHAQHRYGHPHQTTLNQVEQANLADVLVNQVTGPFTFSIARCINTPDDYQTRRGC